jgi:hypothetical protein
MLAAPGAPLRLLPPSPSPIPNTRRRPQATIMTDPGMADRTYVTPMTPELVEQILAKVRRAGARGQAQGQGGRCRLRRAPRRRAGWAGGRAACVDWQWASGCWRARQPS